MKILGFWIAFIITALIIGPCLAGDGHYHLGRLQPTGQALAIAKMQWMQANAQEIAPVDFHAWWSSDTAKANVHASGYKDRKKAFFRSLILPGAGEYYVGKRTFARAFLATEVVFWLSHFAFQQYGKWVRKDALAFAATHSGATIKGKPSQYFVDIGNYSDIYQYNEAKLRFGEYEKLYSETEYYWSWDLDAHRQQFQNLRIASDRARNRATYVLGAIFANHLISAINATWQAVNHNKKLNQTATGMIQIRCFADGAAGRILLQIEKEF